MHACVCMQVTTRTVVVFLVVAAGITAAVVAPVCVLVGCSPHASPATVRTAWHAGVAPCTWLQLPTTHVLRAMQEDSSSLGPARLLVHFGNSSIDALSLVPVVLRPFVTRLLLQSSSLQLLTFDNEEVLQEVTKYIQADPSEHVEDEPSLRKVLSGQDGAVHGMCLCPKCWRGA